MADKKPDTPKTAFVELTRAHWKGDVRHEAGERIELDAEVAARLIEDGAAVAAKA